MFTKNSLPLGMLYGVLPPALVYLLLNYVLHDEALLMNKPAAPYLLAIGVNLLVLRTSAKKHLDQTSNGIMISTFICMLLVFLFKIQAR